MRISPSRSRTSQSSLPFANGWASFLEAQAHAYAGRLDPCVEICSALAAQTGLARVFGLCALATILPIAGRSLEAIALTDETMAAARAHSTPYFIAWAYSGCAMAYTAAVKAALAG